MRHNIKIDKYRYFIFALEIIYLFDLFIQLQPAMWTWKSRSQIYQS